MRAGARQMAEDIRIGIQSLQIAHKNATPPGIVTMSFGVAIMEAQAPVFYEEVINAADQFVAGQAGGQEPGGVMGRSRGIPFPAWKKRRFVLSGRLIHFKGRQDHTPKIRY